MSMEGSAFAWYMVQAKRFTLFVSDTPNHQDRRSQI
jgi:hypothetical protein